MGRKVRKMERITKKIKELGFTEQLHEITPEAYLDIDRKLRCGKWDNRLGDKPDGWDELPAYCNFLFGIIGKLSKWDIHFYAMPKIPYIRKCTRTIQSGKGGIRYERN